MGKKNIILIVIFLVLGIGFGVGGTVGAQKFLFNSTSTKVAVAKEKVTGPLVPIGEFTLNLQGGSFLKISITVEGKDAKSEEFLKSRLPFLKDTVIVELTDKPLTDVQTPVAMEKLRHELLAKLNKEAQDKVVNVLFESFIYQ